MFVKSYHERSAWQIPFTFAAGIHAICFRHMFAKSARILRIRRQPASWNSRNSLAETVGTRAAGIPCELRSRDVSRDAQFPAARASDSLRLQRKRRRVVRT